MKPSPSFGVKVLSALTKITIEKAKVTKSHIIISKINRLKQDFWLVYYLLENTNYYFYYNIL